MEGGLQGQCLSTTCGDALNLQLASKSERISVGLINEVWDEGGISIKPQARQHLVIAKSTHTFECGWSLLSHGAAEIKRLDLGNLNSPTKGSLTRQMYTRWRRRSLLGIVHARGAIPNEMGPTRGDVE